MACVVVVASLCRAVPVSTYQLVACGIFSLMREVPVKDSSGSG